MFNFSDATRAKIYRLTIASIPVFALLFNVTEEAVYVWVGVGTTFFSAVLAFVNTPKAPKRKKSRE